MSDLEIHVMYRQNMILHFQESARTIMNTRRIYIFDTTLRDGGQMAGVNYTLTDKIKIAHALDDAGIDYIEGGWPGANPVDTQFFDEPPQLHSSTFTAFGMTRRSGRSASNDAGFQETLKSKGSAICLVGKAWDFHVETVFKDTSLEDNIQMISDSIGVIKDSGREPLFDCEHFFDGFRANPSYARDCAVAAYEAGARWIVLCDTNGGMLPWQVHDIVSEISQDIPGEYLGIHTHDDTGNAVANSLAAVEAGARMVQGTINGLGERCGNANLCTLIPNLAFKMACDIGMNPEQIKKVRHLSKLVDSRLNRTENPQAPYYGASAFAHKAGLHASAIARESRSYEHIDPSLVDGKRHIILSGMSGRANLQLSFKDLGFNLADDDPRIPAMLERLKDKDAQGYSYDAAMGSLRVLVAELIGLLPQPYFNLEFFRVHTERRVNANGGLTTVSDATVKVKIGENECISAGEGNGPVSALDNAMRKVLTPIYPELNSSILVDFKVGILNASAAANAVTRVTIDTQNSETLEINGTVGVSENIVNAAYEALHDGYVSHLFSLGVPSRIPPLSAPLA